MSRAEPRGGAPMALAVADLACLTADSPERPLDYALVLHFDRRRPLPFSYEGLRRGAEEARRVYPVAASRVRRGAWTLLPRPPGPVAYWRLPGEDTEPLLRRFLTPGFCLDEEPPVRQLLLESGDPPRFSLVTRIHHAASDLVGTLLFVGRQLRAAVGAAEPAAPQRTPPALRQPSRVARRRAPDRPSTPLAVGPGEPSPERRWLTVVVDRRPFTAVSWHFVGFTWNDVLLTAAMTALADWNRQQRASASRIGLWVPMNVRRSRFAGFGNGASRIRVHRRQAPGTSPKERFHGQVRLVREAVQRARLDGDWVLPSGALSRLLLRGAPSVARRYLDRPWADYGTAGFAHLERWPGDADGVFEAVSDFEVVSCLHPRHPLYFAALSRPDHTTVTITWDPALLDAGQVGDIAAGFRRAIAHAKP